MLFDGYCQCLISVTKTDHQAVSLPTFDIFQCFLNSSDPNEIVLIQNHYIWNFQRNWLALYLHHDWRNALKLRKISKNSCVKETGPSYCQKFVFSGNSSQNIWHKLKKYSKIEEHFKIVISNFRCFLTLIVSV